MNVFDFVSNEDMENAPDDPEMAFAQLARVAQDRLRSQIRTYDEQEWRLAQEDRIAYQNFVVGLAKVYEIEPFLSMEVQSPDSPDEAELTRFTNILDHFLVQVVVGAGLRNKRSAVSISPPLKESLRKYVSHIKIDIDKTNLPASHKAALHKKISDFENLLEKNSINYWALARFAFEVLSVSANGVALYESKTINKLISNMFAVVAEAKAINDTNRPIESGERIIAISPPRREEPKPKKVNLREDFPADLDDEIPF